MADVTRVGIIGGGIVGICTAISLLEAGQKVTLIERDAPGQAASFGNAGIISPWSVVPQAMPGIWKQIPGMLLRPRGPAGVSPRHGLRYLPWLIKFLDESRAQKAKANSDAMHVLCGDTVSLYRQLLAGTGHDDLVVDAMYVHAFRNGNAASVQSLGNQMRSQKGADIERINAADLRNLEPALSHDFKAAILIKGQARARDPGRIGEVLAGKIETLGGTILREAVVDLQAHDGAWQIQSDIAVHTFDKVVMAAGAWSADLLRRLNITVPLAAERGYHVSYPDADVILNNSVMDADAHAVASTMNEGMRIAGIAEFAGIDAPPNPKRLAALRRTAEAMLPSLKDQSPKTWMGVRPSFPDSLPVIQEFPGHPGLIGAFGHSHYGLMMAPKTGRLVADIATGKTLNIDMSPFASDRF
ncbi:FAD-binding oxidoreductase [Epibacterium ulvae]|uniref:NAD(P)/FAD-dependent oxidoreductase n=1 Tax=Epibacterium ulvae TaxID=1156985 RepID=UPI001BFCA44F|nr:FAD-dependent oxidoreductase [Epibacterium ulvae]MBT8154702.1 FAD-binding oxidoreductase [Epibacterium ulvae]